MSNVVENNNSFVDFNQVWSEYVFTDRIPTECPDISQTTQKTYSNPDGTVYSIYTFQITTDNETYDYLCYVSNFQLTKEFRQGRYWKFEFNKDEENLRAIILPGTTTSRSYTPSFSNGKNTIPYTSVDPEFDLSNCRIKVGLDFDKLYISGWIYVGKNLQDHFQRNLLPPFDSDAWLIKDLKTGNRVKFNIQQELTYNLPAEHVETLEPHTILTNDIINQVLNEIVDLDEGECW